MRPALWTKLFYFSASFSRGSEVHAHNFTLAITLEFKDSFNEALIEKKIQEDLIQKLHSRDLTLDVDFLKKTEITDHNLLKAFSKIISAGIKPAKLHTVWLERDSRTRLTLPLRG